MFEKWFSLQDAVRLLSKHHKCLHPSTSLVNIFIHKIRYSIDVHLPNITSSMEKAKDVPDDILLPPARVKGMKALDRDAFTKEITVPCVKIPLEDVQSAVNSLRPVFLKLPNFMPIVDSDFGKKIFLNPLILKSQSAEILSRLKQLQLDGVDWEDVALTYSNWLHADILKAVLPEELGDGVAGFSIIGHILHLNLKESYNDYKSIIGQILLDKHPRLRTIVNKVNTIENKFRNFQMELLAGESDFKVEVKENGCRYKFDFSKVFWNPRLSNEHAQLCAKFQRDDIVFDVFAGVGPFAIPAAKKGCTVYANDLNPDSYEWLAYNCKLNKVNDILHCFNLDGKQFIQIVVKSKLTELYQQPVEQKTIHILMNLPASALEFLDAFKNLLKDDNQGSENHMPIVYCYFFSKPTDKENEKTVIAKKYFNGLIQPCDLSIHDVRLVAPNKMMYRLVCRLPFSYLFEDPSVHQEPEPKKMKLISESLLNDIS